MSKKRVWVEKRIRLFEDGHMELMCTAGKEGQIEVVIASMEEFSFEPQRPMSVEQLVKMGKNKGWFDDDDLEVFARVLVWMVKEGA
jgi:hypothetical protein